MISQSAEYSLRAVVCLASRPEVPLTTHQIAAIAKIPAGYLSKILQSLGRAGLVTSQRGIHGGFALTKDPAELTVLQVLQCVEQVQRIRKCPLGLPQHEGQLCSLHHHLDRAMAAAEKAFADCTIADLLSDGNSAKPLTCACAVPK